VYTYNCNHQSCVLTIQQCCNMLCWNVVFVSLYQAFSQHSKQIKLNIFCSPSFGTDKIAWPWPNQNIIPWSQSISSLCFAWLTEQVKGGFLACLQVFGIACFVPPHTWNCFLYVILHVTYQNCLVKKGGYQPCSFFTCLWTMNMQKITWSISRHLDLTVSQ